MRVSPSLLALVFCACHPSVVSPPVLPSEDSDPPGDSRPDDSVPQVGDTSTEDIGDNPGNGDDNDWVFSDETVFEVEIELGDAELRALRDDPQEYVHGAIVFDGRRLDDVGVRLKGRLGAFRTLDDKAAFKIDLNRYVDGQDLDGLEKLTFNNMVVDCSGIKELMSWRIFESLGLPAARVGYAWVSVNGEVYGLYAHIESIDDEFLKRHFEQPDGNLYEGEYLLYPDDSYVLADFEDCCDQYITLDEGTDAWEEQVHGLTLALDAHAGRPDFYEQLGQRVNWPHHHLTVAAETWAGHNDGYSLNSNNYRVYYDPADDGRAAILSWDMDYTFLEASSWGLSWSAGRGRLTHACVQDPACRAAQRAVVSAACDTMDEVDLVAVYDRAKATVDPYLRQDPREECGSYYTDYYQGQVRSWIDTGSARARSAWDL